LIVTKGQLQEKMKMKLTTINGQSVATQREKNLHYKQQVIGC